MPDVRELGRRVKAKYPGAYDDLDDADVGRRVKAKYPGAYDDFVDAPAPASEEPGFFSRTASNIKTGLQRGGASLGEAAFAVADIITGMKQGDVRPLHEAGERAGRGFYNLVGAVSGDTFQGNEIAENLTDPARLQQAIQSSETRRLTESPFKEGFQDVKELKARADVRAARDPSLTGKIIRRGTEFATLAAPAVATGIATGGSVPSLAAVAALQSAGQPENLPLNVALEAAPLPVGQAFRAGINTVRRTLGKGAAQIIEAEATPAAVAQVRRSLPEPLGAAPGAVEEGSGVFRPPVEAIPSPVRRLDVLDRQGAPLLGADLPETAAESAARMLQSASRKLGTDDIDQIGAMIANANRRLGKKRTPEQIQSSMDDYNALRHLTPDEQRALAQVLPERKVSPVGKFPQGGYAREVRDIPMSEPEISVPQLDANQRALQAFFGEEGRALQAAEDAAIMGDIGPGATSGSMMAQPGRVSVADLVTTPAAPSAIADRIRTMVRTPTSPVLVGDVRRQFPGVGKKEFDDEMIRLVEDGQIALHRHDAPGLLSQAERDAMVKIGKDYYTAATVRGPSVGGPLDAMTVAPASPGGTVIPPPPGGIPTGFGGSAPGPQAHLFDYAPSLSRLTHIWQRTKDELFGALGATKSLKSSYDISYPFRQGSLLLLRPLQWRQAAKTWASAFKGFRTKNFEEIKQAIEFHPLAKRMEGAGLYRGTVSGEEAFPGRAGSRISAAVEKTPGVKQSQQAYTAAADTQRVQAFEQYARAIDRAGLSTAEALKADKAAAEWINIATGRGSLGQKLDRALDALNITFFSPRYIASRLNVLNPAMYIRNASSPGGRVVLRQQMADLAQFMGVVATTLYLAKQAGADVGLNPENPDFLKIRFGNHRYDTLAGLQQVMRAGYRISADIFGRAFRGEKPRFGESAIDIGETFLSYKLAPPASVFRSFINQRTPGGKEFTAARAAADLVAPIQWADFVDAWRDESFGAALKTLPGATGIGAQHYQFDPVEAALDRNRPLLSELQRLKIRVAELERLKEIPGTKYKPSRPAETDDQFNARIQQFSQNYTSYGLRLIGHPRFQIASDEVKTRALKRLNEKARGLTRREFAFPEIELDPGLILDSVEK